MATSRHSNKVLPPDNGAPQQSRCNPPSAGLVVRQSLLGAARTTDASSPETADGMVTIALTPRQKRGAHAPTVRRAVRRGGDRGGLSRPPSSRHGEALTRSWGCQTVGAFSQRATQRGGGAVHFASGRPALVLPPICDAPRTPPRTLPQGSVRAAPSRQRGR